MTANAFHNIFQIDSSLGGSADSLHDISERISIDSYCTPLPDVIALRHDLLRPRMMCREMDT